MCTHVWSQINQTKRECNKCFCTEFLIKNCWVDGDIKKLPLQAKKVICKNN